MWLPKGAAKAKAPLPILLFFYGGSWVTGTAMTPVYGGQDVVSLHNDVIVVTANYRLGPFRWGVT